MIAENSLAPRVDEPEAIVVCSWSAVRDCGEKGHLDRDKLMSMSPSASATTDTAKSIRGKIIEAEIKVVVDAARPLPLACALYAIETSEGVWLCAYYGMNKSVFDYLPQKGAEVDEITLGITFHHRQLVLKEQFAPQVWEEFKKARLIGND